MFCVSSLNSNLFFGDQHVNKKDVFREHDDIELETLHHCCTSPGSGERENPEADEKGPDKAEQGLTAHGCKDPEKGLDVRTRRF